ncbi:MAG: formate dehydrogenase accessory protein FdhE [Syntrophales bacterium]|nr:formate dehydrogenase accessory protein FdhE [Syntrophales bacterium]
MLTDILKIIQAYKLKSPHYEELLDILEDIFILRENCKHNLKKIIFPIDERLVPAKISGGFPLVDLATTDFDVAKPREYFLQLLSIAEKRAPQETAEFAEKIRSGEIDFHEMLLDAFYGPFEEEENDEGDAAFDLIDMLLEECLRPFLEMVAVRYGEDIIKYGWSEGYCPICGKEPKIGEIKDEDDNRYLFCNQCGLTWQYPRIKCPFCGNEEQQTLAYFTVEDDDRYRVDVCNKCKRYIKIIDFRESKAEVNLEVEDITTLHLDLLANEEGYE